MIFRKIKKIVRSIRTDYAQYKMVKPCLAACDDRLSKSIMMARLNYYSVFLSDYKKIFPWIKCSYYRFHKKINSLINPIYKIPSLESISGKSIVLFGEGDGYKYTKNLLKRSDWKNSFRCIGNSIEDIKKIKGNEVLIMPGSPYRDNVLYKKIQKLYPNVNIFERDFILVGETRNQYLDVFEPQEEEYIVDCGAFDGKTEELFNNWGSGHVKKIYAFELDPFNKAKCSDFYDAKGLKDIVEFINKGVSNSNAIVHIEDSSMGSSGSHLGPGTIEAEVVKLDDTLVGKVTFIKMDVEGAELDALKGAAEIIKSQKPRLAICLYHKQSDIYEIPRFLLSIEPSYKFIIRHYSSISWETVLYAYV